MNNYSEGKEFTMSRFEKALGKVRVCADRCTTRGQRA